MEKFELAFAAWLTFLSSVDVDIDAVLNEPATDEEISNLELAIGMKLPVELKMLYRKTNGQQSPYSANPQPGKYAVNLLGNYDFLSIDEALENYRFQQELREELGSSIDDSISVRDEDPVYGVDWKKEWLPIAGSDASQIAIDLDPPINGTIGQLINMGPDDSERAVLAASLSDRFETMATGTPVSECNLEYGVPDTSGDHTRPAGQKRLNGYILYFAASWTYPFIQDFCKYNEENNSWRDSQPAYIEQMNDINSRFGTLMEKDGMRNAEIMELIGETGFHLSTMAEGKNASAIDEINTEPSINLQPGELLPKEFIKQFSNHGQIFPNGRVPLSYVGRERLWLSSYYSELERGFCFNGLLTKERIHIFHQLLFQEGFWTKHDFNQAELILNSSSCP